MCGRYFLKLPDTAFGEKIKRKTNEYSLFYKEGEIFPFDDVLVFIRDKDQIDIRSMKWGLKEKHRINARKETLINTDIYKGMRPCAIIASGFYEWHDKKKYFINTDSEIIYLAAIYNDEGLLIITEDSYKDMCDIHDRIPIIFNNKEMLEYLFQGDLKHMMKDIQIKEV